MTVYWLLAIQVSRRKQYLGRNGNKTRLERLISIQNIKILTLCFIF